MCSFRTTETQASLQYEINLTKYSGDAEKDFSAPPPMGIIIAVVTITCKARGIRERNGHKPWEFKLAMYIGPARLAAMVSARMTRMNLPRGPSGSIVGGKTLPRPPLR